MSWRCVGPRFEASREYRVNVNPDFAAGDGTSAIDFSIGEAFQEAFG